MTMNNSKKSLAGRIISLALAMIMALGVCTAGIPVMMIKAGADDFSVWDGSYPSSVTSSDYTDSNNEIHIKSAKGFAYFASSVKPSDKADNTGSIYANKNIILDCNIDMNNKAFYGIGFYYTWTSGWFNTGHETKRWFSGNFNGNGKTIKNINISIAADGRSHQHRVGLFRHTANATIHDVTLENVSVNVTSSGSAGAGALIGFADASLSVYNVTVSSGTVSGVNRVAGIVGECNPTSAVTFNNCKNGAAITSISEGTGGIVGHNDDKSNDNVLTFINCSNTGNIRANNGDAGGIAGHLYNDGRHVFTNLTNSGDINATGEAGGIIGKNYGFGTYTNIINTGTITSSGDNAGGIVGDIEDDMQTFTNCYNTGDVTGPQSIGGIFGCGRGGNAFTFTSCANSGTIISTGLDAGGLFGHHDGDGSPEFTECWNIGTVYAYNDGGGICGHSKWHSLFWRTWNAGNVNTYNGSNGSQGGIIGYTGDDGNNSAKVMEDCYNWGSVSDAGYNGGLVGYVNGGKTYNIRNSYNAGSVSGGNAKAIISYGGNADSSCYYNSSVSMGTAQGTAKTSQQLIDYGFTISSNFCKNTWGVKIGNTTYYYPILTWYRNMFGFESKFVDSASGIDETHSNKYNTTFTSPNPSRTGYSVSDWYVSTDNTKTLGRGITVTAGITSPTNTLTVEQSFSELTSVKNTTTYNLTWTANSYTVTFNGNGATGGSTTSPQNFTYDTAQNLNANGYIREYTVSFDANGGTVSPASATATATFNGWATSAGGAKVYNNQQSVNNLTATNGGTVPLYANWTLGSVALPTPALDQHDFLGWSLNNNDISGSSYSPQSDVTLVARWDRVTLNDTYVIDNMRPVELNVLGNDPKSTATITAVSKDEADTDFTIAVSNGKVLFTPTRIIDGVKTFEYNVSYNSKSFSATVTVIPATSVYIEEDFGGQGSEFVKFSTTNDKVQWRNVTSTYEEAANGIAEVYGECKPYDTTASAAYSLGNAKIATVSKDNKSGPTASFTFTGTGFEVYSMTDSDSGVIVYKITDSNNQTTTEFINTYLGYSWGPLYMTTVDGVDKITLEETLRPIYYTDSTGAGTFFIGDYEGTAHASSRGTTDSSIGKTQAYGWVMSDSGAVYQVPVISKTGLEYGTYTVTLEPRYSAMQSGGRDSYSFILDSIRIYDPINPNPDVNDANAVAANNRYKEDNEYAPQYKTIRDILIADTENPFGGNGNGVALLDSKGGTISIEDYKNFGTKNETYLNPGQAIAFNLSTTSNVKPEKITIGVRVVQGSNGSITVNGETYQIKGATEIYRDITSFVDMSLSDGVYTTDSPIVIVNTSGSDSGIMISLTKIRWSYSGTNANAPLNARELVFSFDEPSLLKCQNMMSTLFNPVITADATGVTARWDKTTIVPGETATLTITADENYTNAFVDGAETAAYTEKEGVRTWTYTFTGTATGENAFDVKLRDINGYSTNSIAVSNVKVVAPTVSASDAQISWESQTVTLGDKAVLTITTPANIVKVTIGDTEITEYTETENGRQFIFETTPESAGVFRYSVILTETFGYSSANGTTPGITVKVPAADEPDTPENPENPENPDNPGTDDEPEKELNFFEKLVKFFTELFAKVINIFKKAVN